MLAANEAAAIARGEQPVARITIKGHTYVSLAEYTATIDGLCGLIDVLRAALDEAAQRPDARGHKFGAEQARATCGDHGNLAAKCQVTTAL